MQSCWFTGLHRRMIVSYSTDQCTKEQALILVSAMGLVNISPFYTDCLRWEYCVLPFCVHTLHIGIVYHRKPVCVELLPD